MDANESARWMLATELLGEVLDLPRDQRIAAVKRLGGGAGVTAELTRLYEAALKVSVLDVPLDQLFDQAPSAQVIENAMRGKTFNGWLLGEEIGRGGMSVVYRATRSGDGFEQVAALKILSIAFLGKEHVESFLRERKILSELKHPCIARMIDGGITPDGAPFLVMELVEGERIDKWCDAHGADLKMIVKLMLKLSRAAAHAQRHLVVHRDISPANVLVDKRGQPVLVDFGIAKLLGEAETGKTLHAFTPEFAAPEQRAKGEITTATDVYGLGRLLSHLLKGAHIDRDLQLIIHVATHEDPDKRYANAMNMADDLKAWIDRRPVRARPDSLLYRAQKIAQRHWQALGVACLAALIGLGGLISTSFQARISRQEAEKHRVVADFMLDLFQQADLMRTGGDLRVTDMLETAMNQAMHQLDKDPETLVSLLTLIASGQIELTNYDAAEKALDVAGQLMGLHPISDKTTGEYLLQRGKQAHEQGDFVGAVDYLEQAFASLKATGSTDKSYYLAGANLVSYLVDAERYDEALARSIQLIAEVARSGDLESTILVTHRHAVALEVSGELDPAFEQYLIALDLQRNYQPNNHLGRASILSDYGISLYFADRFEEAETVNREVLEIYQQQFRPPHPRVSSAMHNLAFAQIGQSRFDEAIDLLQQAYEMSVQLHGPEHIDSLLEQATLGTLKARTGEFAQAETIFRDNLQVLDRVAPDMRMQRGSVRSYLGDALLQTNRLEESRAEYTTALELFSDLPRDHIRVIEVNSRLEEIDSKLTSRLQAD